VPRQSRQRQILTEAHGNVERSSFPSRAAQISVIGTLGSTVGSSWSTVGDTTQTLDPTGSWETNDGGGYEYTGGALDNWSYGGSGPVSTYADATTVTPAGVTAHNVDDISTTLNETAAHADSSTYTVNTDIVGGEWVTYGDQTVSLTETGNSTLTGNNFYTHVTASGSGTPNSAHSSVGGIADIDFDSDWSTVGSSTQTLGDDGAWTLTAGATDYTGSSDNYYTFLGDGSLTVSTSATGAVPGSTNTAITTRRSAIPSTPLGTARPGATRASKWSRRTMRETPPAPSPAPTCIPPRARRELPTPPAPPLTRSSRAGTPSSR
jgi:hypothetical protein